MVKISTLATAIILLSGILYGMGTFYDDLYVRYYEKYPAIVGVRNLEGKNASVAFSEKFNRTKDVVEASDQIKGSIENIMGNKTIVEKVLSFGVDVPILLLSTGKIMLSIPTQLYGLAENFLGFSNTVQFIPSWLYSVVIATIVVSFIFAILAIFLRSEV